MAKTQKTRTAQEEKRIQEERNKKWEERSKKFFGAFLFTKDGKPKSGFLIYTFFLSFAMIAVYFLAFWGVIDLMGERVQSSSYPFLINLVQSLAASLIALLIAALLHRVIGDKRMMLGTYLWLVLYAVAMLITEIVLLWGSGSYAEFFYFMLWFVFIPLVVALPAVIYLYRRDYHPVAPLPKEESWEKYINT